MEAPPQSTQMLLTRLCSQMEAPPQSLQTLLRRLCSQMEAPPQSLHWCRCRLCSQMEQAERARANAHREMMLFIGTQFSILYTFVYSPA